ncbi:MAG: hypothetical protein LBR76_02970 [Oscillospiraceae bacterium]|jgi:outer membrane lipoprotein-sorting protein|nr:hypothetical protein [Oscillospiraceae bacterium]
MRVKLICILTIPLLLAAGCASGAEGRGNIADRIREHYAAIGTADYRVTLRTDFGDRVLDFTVDYAQKPVASRMKIIAPEPVEGIEAELGANGVTLQYDGTVLELGALPGTGLSPMESLPFIIGQWAHGYVTQTGSEVRAGRTLLMLSTRVTQGSATLDTATWFDGETLKPINAELSVDGLLTVSAFFEA